MAKEVTISDPKYVKLTRNEMSQLRKLKVGQVFYHVNLDHPNTIKHPIYTKFNAVEIIKTGKISRNKVIDPEMNIKDDIKLKLLRTERNIKVSDLNNIKNKQMFLIDNTIGLYESLVDRYSKVLQIAAVDIHKMNCYIRKFKILD